MAICGNRWRIQGAVSVNSTNSLQGCYSVYPPVEEEARGKVCARLQEQITCHSAEKLNTQVFNDDSLASKGVQDFRKDAARRYATNWEAFFMDLRNDQALKQALQFNETLKFLRNWLVCQGCWIFSGAKLRASSST